MALACSVCPWVVRRHCVVLTTLSRCDYLLDAADSSVCKFDFDASRVIVSSE